MNLPFSYLDRIKDLLGAEYDEFLASYNAPAVRGLRVNLLRGTVSDYLKKTPFSLEPSGILDEGFVITDAHCAVGNHPHHMGGAYYIQEPSAMSVLSALDKAGALLNVSNGIRVLDMCAAPGGKSTGIAARLNGRGILVANEIVFSRAKELAKNVERMGITNCVVTSASPDIVSKKLPEYFDIVLVDAPCSGEGMFRKNPDAVTEWSTAGVTACAARQALILNSAAKSVCAGGYLAYSTCTFEREENEDVISGFLSAHADFRAVLFERLYPHKIKGEGHFVCVMKKNGSDSPNRPIISAYSPLKSAVFNDFIQQTFITPPSLNAYARKNSDIVLLCDNEMLSIASALPTVACGVVAGELKGAYFAPAHSLFMAEHKGTYRNTLEFSTDSGKLNEFLHGNETDCFEGTGYASVRCDGFPVGFGKLSQGRLKNKLPKGLRLMK